MTRKVNWPFAFWQGFVAAGVIGLAWFISRKPYDPEVAVGAMILTAVALSAALASWLVRDSAINNRRLIAAGVLTWLIFSATVGPVAVFGGALVRGRLNVALDDTLSGLMFDWLRTFLQSTVVAFPAALFGAATFIGVRKALRRWGAAAK